MMRPRWRQFILIASMIVQFCIFSDSGSVLASSEATDSETGSISRELVSLAEKWNLTDNGVEFGGMNFQLGYITSDFILDNMVGAVAYTRECKEGGVTIPAQDMNVTLVPDDTPAGEGDLERSFSVDVTVDPRNIETSSVFSMIQGADGNSEARVEFCMRFSLYTSSTLIEVNYLETIVVFTANLNSGFIVDANVQPKELILTTATDAFDIDAYQCDRNNVPLTTAALAKAMNQGEIIRVCVTPSQEAKDEGLFMKEIKSFSYYRDYGGPIGIVTQVAIENSQEASNYLTVMDCTPGDIICIFETILFASMFMSPGFVEGSGTAVLQFGTSATSRERQLRGESDSPDRLLQGSSAESQFDLDFELVPGEPFDGKLRTSSSSRPTIITTFIVMGTLTILNWVI